MQRLASHFREYLGRIYTNQARQIITGAEVIAARNEDTEQVATETEPDENGSRTSDGKLKIVIDWGALDVDREPQTISEDQASDSIVKLLVEIIGAFVSEFKDLNIHGAILRRQHPCQRQTVASIIPLAAVNGKRPAGIAVDLQPGKAGCSGPFHEVDGCYRLLLNCKFIPCTNLLCRKYFHVGNYRISGIGNYFFGSAAS